MGRLYDKKDLAWNLDFWNRQEQRLHAGIANGRYSGSILDEVITESRDHKGRPCGRGCGCKTYKLRDKAELERKRERMKLLRTGMLLHELGNWESLVKACSSCHQVAKKGGGLKWQLCLAHAEGYTKAKSAVWWAGEHNIEERNARGQRRADGLSTAKEALEGLPEGTKELNPLNKWESLYQRDKAEGAWLPADAKHYDTAYSYKGWLEMLWINEEIAEEEYREELGRLRALEREMEEAASMAPMGKLKRDRHQAATYSGYTNLT